MGSLSKSLGDKLKALDYYEQALPLYRVIYSKAGEALILHCIGNIYRDLGEMEQALNCLEKSLLLYRLVEDKSGEFNTLLCFFVCRFCFGILILRV
jgi:tetratricopeptide (TPR) repeat protein